MSIHQIILVMCNKNPFLWLLLVKQLCKSIENTYLCTVKN